MAIDGAYAWVVNSAALQAANITADTPDPPGGAIVKDAAGQPTGLLRNVGDLIGRFRGSAEDTVPLSMLERVHEAYAQAGITSVIERGATLDGWRTYRALRRDRRQHKWASRSPDREGRGHHSYSAAGRCGGDGAVRAGASVQAWRR